jgi:hypothetical protein
MIDPRNVARRWCIRYERGEVGKRAAHTQCLYARKPIKVYYIADDGLIHKFEKSGTPLATRHFLNCANEKLNSRCTVMEKAVQCGIATKPIAYDSEVDYREAELRKLAGL